MSTKSPEAPLLTRKIHEFLVEVIASGLTFSGAGIQASGTAKGLRDDYTDAGKRILHAQRQGKRLRSNQIFLNGLPLSKKEATTSAETSINDPPATSPTDIDRERKRDCVEWALSRKSTFSKETTQSSLSETSLKLDLMMPLCQDLEKLKLDLENQPEDPNKGLKIRPRIECLYELMSNSRSREQRLAILDYLGWVADRLGVKLGIVISMTGNRGSWDLSAKWPRSLPLELDHAITARLRSQHWIPSPLKLALSSQNTIPPDSAIIKACELQDIPKIQEILGAKEAHPNDRTPDNLTVFRYAIRTADVEIVKLLLDQGADPNLSFGQYNTSPLNNAFLVGSVAIIRLLLNAGADLDYRNLRTWFSITYLWDRDRPSHSSASEILDICMSNGFTGWNDLDARGWTPNHRAAAYGRGEDIHDLKRKGGNMHSYTTEFLWGPVTCAVWASNESTFDAFMELLPVAEILSFKDTRDWNLLHMAAKEGCEHIMRTLLRIGADTEALTLGTRYWVIDNLDWKRLKAETIAKEYGHGEMWKALLKERDKETMISPEYQLIINLNLDGKDP